MIPSELTIAVPPLTHQNNGLYATSKSTKKNRFTFTYIYFGIHPQIIIGNSEINFRKKTAILKKVKRHAAGDRPQISFSFKASPTVGRPVTLLFRREEFTIEQQPKMA